MTEPQLHLIDRTRKPYKNAKAALRDSFVPGVLYGKGIEPQTFFVDESALVKLLADYGIKRRIKITLNDKSSSAIIKDCQKDVLKNKIIHIDLQALNEHEKVKVSSPIHFINRETVEKDNKILQIQTSNVEIQMLPRHMPESVTVDAALLLEKDSITLSDLNIADNENIEILNEPDTVVATLVYAKRAEETSEEADTSEDTDNSEDAETEKTDSLEGN